MPFNRLIPQCANCGRNGSEKFALRGGMAETNSTERIFAEALTRSPAERQRYLDTVCAGNVERRQDVDSLLEAHEQARGFLEDIPDEPAARTPTIRVSTPLP